MRHILAVAVGLIALSAFPALTHAYEIRNDATGGDCTQIGTWNAGTKTCTLTTNLDQTIRISDSDITLDGNNKTITGDNVEGTVDRGIDLSSSRNATVKNLTIEKFFEGIKAQSSENVTIDHVTVRNNGIDPDQANLLLLNTNGATISDSTFVGASIYSIARSYNLHFVRNIFDRSPLYFAGTTGILVTDNTFANAGISVGSGDGCASTTIVRNTITGGDINLVVSSSPNLITDNTVEGRIMVAGGVGMVARNHVRKPAGEDGYYGISIRGTGSTLVDNEVSGCTGGESRCSNYTLLDIGGGMVLRNRSEGGKIGFELWNASGVTFTDNTVIGANEAAVSITGKDSGLFNNSPNIFTANTFRDGAVGIKAVEPYDFQVKNIFSKNIFTRNTSNTEVSYSNPDFIKLFQPLPDGGNYWDRYDTAAEGCVDSNSDHVCDSSYVAQSGSQQLVDQYPLTCPSGITCTSTKTPVLFIPGIMGTEMSKNGELLWADIDRMIKSVGIPFVSRGDQFLDPLAFKPDGTASDTAVTATDVISRKAGSFLFVPYSFDYTTGLTSELLSRGYSTSTNSTSSVFALFPYDWRKDIADVANNELKAKIDTLLSQTGSQKIDIIAHSQGGLLIKKLLLDYPAYKSKIRKLIFLGTPQLGAPKAAKSLLYGDPSGVSIGYKMLNINFLDSDEVKYIGHNMPSAYELLPSPTYFTATSSYLGVDALVNAPPAMVVGYNNTTNKLKALGLNAALLDRATAFHQSGIDTMNFSNSGIDVTNIVSCGRPSPGQIIKSSWGRSRITYVPGDGTVPVLSASALQGASTTYYIWDKRVEHAGMPSAAGVRQSLADILEGKSVYEDPAVPSTFYTVSYGCNLSGHEFDVHSPVDLNIYDSAGNHLGPTDDGGFEANIPGSSYDTLGDEKFAFVPEGNYTIKLNATDSGHFSFFSSKIENNETVSTASYLDIPITATSKAQVITNDTNTQTIALDTTGQGMATTTVTPTAVLTGSSTDDLTPPITTLIATGTKVGSYYTSNVTITFSATDTATSTETASGVLKTEYAYDNSTSTIWRTATTSILATTTTTLYYYSTDRLGNKEAIASTTIVINKSAPTTHHLTTGTTTPFTDPTGTLWQGDQYFVGGTMASRGAIAIANTLNDRLYQSERYGMTGYAIPVPNGTYQVTLHFAETSPSVTATGQRTFTVALEGTTILTNLDIFKEAGKNAALVKTFTTSVTDGTLNLTFTKVVNAPEINGIEVMPADTTPPSTPTNLTAVAASSSQINLTWATSTDAVGYQLERCTGATCTTFLQIATTTVPTYKNTGLTASTTYRFRVRAYDQAGNRSTYSTTTTITTPKAPQTIFQDTFESALTWTKTGAVTWYTGSPKVGTHAVKLTTTASIEKAVSLQNYQNITVSFRMGANSLDTNSENVQALYYNGSTWITLAQINNNTTNENNQLNPYTFTLPATMNNKTTFKLRFKINGSSTDDAAFVDEVVVRGVRM